MGWATKRFAKGYTLHACALAAGRIPAFSIRPMNAGEAKLARERLAPVPEATLILADTNYDTQHLYKALGARDQQLLTPLKRIAVNPAPLRRMGPHRRFASDLHHRLGQGYRTLLDQRDQIERIFSALTCFGGGLTTLPPWIRRLDRVTRWVTAKIAV